MKPKELAELIDSLSCDIEFSYNNKHGAICPFNRNNIALGYDDKECSCSSIDEVMNTPFFDGMTLNQISTELVIY